MSTLWFGVTAPSGWVGEKLVLHKLRFHPDLLRPFPPLAKGGLGGVVPARPVTRSSDALSLSVLSHPSRKAGKGIARSRRHSIARNKNTRLETVPPTRSTPTSHRPTLRPPGPCRLP